MEKAYKYQSEINMMISV